MRFKAYTKIGGSSKAIRTSLETDLPSSQAKADALTSVDTNYINKMKAVARNGTAIISFMLAFTTDVMLSLVMEAETDEWLEDLACEVVKQLNDKFRLRDMMSLVNEKMALNDISMKKNQDSKSLFEQIKAVETRFNTKTRKISEADKIAIVLSKALKAYQSMLTIESRIQKVQGIDVTLKDLQEAIAEHYCLISRDNNNDENEDKVALAYFDRKCNKCKKHGYKATGCRNKIQPKKSKKFKYNCNNCGKYGHKVADCWELPKNADKRPKG